MDVGGSKQFDVIDFVASMHVRSAIECSDPLPLVFSASDSVPLGIKI